MINKWEAKPPIVFFFLLAKLIIGISKSWIRGKEISLNGHNHDASNITSGTLPLARGGTGVTSISALKSALGISSGGGVKISTYSRVGDDNQTYKLTFSFTPYLIISAGPYNMMFCIRGYNYTFCAGSYNSAGMVTFSGSSVTFTCSSTNTTFIHNRVMDKTYSGIAICM